MMQFCSISVLFRRDKEVHDIYQISYVDTIQILLKFHKWFEKLYKEMENLTITH
jgi:hypothetical protein